MNNEELRKIQSFLGANLINIIFINPENISYEEVLVWNDLSYDDKWDNIPDGLVFTGGALTDIDFLPLFNVNFPFNIFKKIIIHIKFINNNYSLIDSDQNNWSYISEHFSLDEYTITEFADKFDWMIIANHQVLSEKFILDNESRLDGCWDEIESKQFLSENLLKKFKEKLDWDFLCEYKKLSEELMGDSDLEDYINWYVISQTQSLSEDFIIAHQDKIYWYGLMGNNHLSDDLKSSLKDQFENKYNFNFISFY